MEIRVEVSRGALWGNVDPDNGYNRFLSEREFCETAEITIEEEYPGADVEVAVDDRDFSRIDGEDSDDIDMLIDKAWNGDWMVAA